MKRKLFYTTLIITTDKQPHFLIEKIIIGK